MITFNQFILNESICWDSPIRMQGSPTPQPVVAEHITKEYHIKITLDTIGYGEGNPQKVRQILVKTPKWNKQLIWIYVKIGNDNKTQHIFESFLDTPENRIKIEQRYKEIIYALMRVKNHRPKMIVGNIEKLVKSPL